VEVSSDAGQTWADAKLELPVSEFAWRGWRFDWDARSGRFTLLARATTTEGTAQPTEPPWTYQGMANNVVQPVEVFVL
jgi:hypothetical protein